MRLGPDGQKFDQVEMMTCTRRTGVGRVACCLGGGVGRD